MKWFIILCLFVALNFSASADVFFKNKNLVQKIDSVASAAGTTVLTKTSNYWQELTGATTQTYTLPDATTMSTGRSFGFKNNSSGAATINDNSSGLIKTLAGGDSIVILLTDNSGAAGTWTTMEPESTPLASHAANHVDGGSDVVDGDKLQIDFSPSSYTPDTAPAEVDQTDQLTAHLKGIENALDAKLTSTPVEALVYNIPTPDITQDPEFIEVPYAFTINSVKSICASGTANWDLEIDGVDVTGCAGQQTTSVLAADTCTAANSVSINETVTINFTSVSTPDFCRFTIKITRE